MFPDPNGQVVLVPTQEHQVALIIESLLGTYMAPLSVLQHTWVNVFAPNRVAHELGHFFGLRHPNDTPVFGVGTETSKILGGFAGKGGVVRHYFNYARCGDMFYSQPASDQVLQIPTSSSALLGEAPSLERQCKFTYQLSESDAPANASPYLMWSPATDGSWEHFVQVIINDWASVDSSGRSAIATSRMGFGNRLHRVLMQSG